MTSSAKEAEFKVLAHRLIEDPIFTEQDFERLRELAREIKEGHARGGLK